MSEHDPADGRTSSAESTDPYHVVLLVEKTLSQADASGVHELHTGIGGPVTYHVLMPVEDAAARIEASLGTLAAGELMTAPGMMLSEADLEAVRQECQERTEHELAVTMQHLRASGADAIGEVVSRDPVDALVAAVQRVEGNEVVVLTRPHVVAEFLHLDWTSRARRKLGVPILHLLEHETDEAAEADGDPETGREAGSTE